MHVTTRSLITMLAANVYYGIGDPARR